MGPRIGRGQQEVTVGRGISARLAKHSFAQAIAMLLEIRFLLEHCATRNVEHAAGDYSSWFAAGMKVYGCNHAGETHYPPFRSNKGRSVRNYSLATLT
jgi:hypothetical protein